MVAPPQEPDAQADDEEVDAAPWELAAERREAIVSESLHGLRLDKVLVTLAPEFSRNHLQGLIEQGHVRLDEQVAGTASRKLRAGQHLAVDLVPTAQSLAFRPESMPLDVVFEDAELMVVDKPAGMVVHPAAGNWSGTLLNGLLAHHAGALLLPRAGIVHRLDKDTSGLMVVGKTLATVGALSRAIAAREVRREYLAIAHGLVTPTLRRIELSIGRDPKSRVRMAAMASGKPARTDLECIARGLGCSALRCRLHTGRTHQIRVHLSARGHPLVADALYGGTPILGLQRQALHAVRLSFAHPSRGQAMQFEAAPPPDFAEAWQAVVDAG